MWRFGAYNMSCDTSVKDNFLDNTIRKSYNYGIACELSLTHNRRNLTDGMLSKMLVVIAVLVITSSLSQEAFADTSLTLYKIPSSVNEGQIVTFTGVLYNDGRPLANKVVYIQESDFGPDEVLASGWTDQNGRFSIQWRAEAATVEIEFDIYAIFEGDSYYNKDRTNNQYMDVYERSKIDGSITLDPFQRTAKVGQEVTFSGTLKLNSGSPTGAAVYIKDEDSFSRDELLVTAYVESNGRFSATWIAEHTDFDSTIDIFAVFEGDSKYYRQATCNSVCGNAMPLHISGHVNTSPLTTPPSNIPDGSQYMEMKYALNMYKPPHVAIVPDPDAYNQVRSHIVPVKEGIDVWSHELERRYSGGNWDVTGELVTPGDRFNSKPDVIVNLVTHERDDGCLNDYFGWALRLPNLNNPIQTTVCSTFGGEKNSNQDVAIVAGHEFIHAMGLGHAFNKSGDVMCSVEDTGPTCQSGTRQSSIPSSLNLGAVAKIYGTDGFQNPNNSVKYESRYAEGGSTRTQPNVQPPSTPPQTRTQYPNGCTTDDKRYNISLTDRELKPGWSRWYTICNTGTVQYSFSATDRDAGFALYVLPPATDARDYVKNGKGYPHPCEDTTKHWFSKSNTCYLRVGSSIVLHNDRDVSITINGRITTNVREQSFPNGCIADNANYDFTANDFTLKPGWYKPYIICNTGQVEYQFSVAEKIKGFSIYVLPPETDVSAFVKTRSGYYKTCEDPDKHWFNKPGNCTVTVGSHIVIHNDRDIPMTINGWIRT